MEPWAVRVEALAPPVAPPAPRRSRRRPVLLVLSLLTAVTVAAAVRASAAPRVPDLHQVTTPATAEQGWSPEWVDDAGRPVRWDPCTPIHYVLNPGWAPEHGRDDLAEALRRLSAVSGLEFVDDGDTDEVPSRERAAYQPQRYGDRWAPVLVAWVPESGTDMGIGGGIQGLTSTVAVPSPAGGSLVTAEVALDADHRLGSGFGAGTTEGEVLMHELAHVVGLGHVADPTQVMYFATTNSESAYGRGDRAGLTALGATAGCDPAPRASAR